MAWCSPKQLNINQLCTSVFFLINNPTKLRFPVFVVQLSHFVTNNTFAIKKSRLIAENGKKYPLYEIFLVGLILWFVQFLASFKRENALPLNVSLPFRVMSGTTVRE
jgi:hypothetical protein